MEAIQKKIDKLLAQKDMVIVAIDGKCTSGKTTLAAKLAEVYDCNVFHMDDFFLRPEQRTPERFAEVGGNVDYERFSAEVLTPLKAEQPFSYRPFNCSTFTLADPVCVTPKKLNIIEGTYSHHPYFGDPYDLKILLTVDEETQRQRILERPAFLQKRFFEEWIPMEDRYFNALKKPSKTVTNPNIEAIIQAQREYFSSGATLSYAFRMEALGKLETAIQKNEQKIYAALHADLGKSETEAFMCEVGLVQSEISWMKKNLKRLMKRQKVKTPMVQFAADSFRTASPYGTVLIMSPWNYPVLISLSPLVAALAAGNTAVLKPSSYSPATSELLKTMLEEAFPAEYVCVVTGGRSENQALLHLHFDKIFFTGSTAVGKEVMCCASEHLTPVTLELGGKSPCIVEKTAKLRLAAKRIVFGKFVNCGQTCVAPDYILCDSSIRDRLVEAIRQEIYSQFGAHPLENPNYGKIINEKHYRRLLDLIDSEKVVHGGDCDETACRIAPTVMTNVTWDDAVMQEEIFGPILPIVTCDSLEQAIATIESRPRPLALYCFTEDKAVVDRVLTSCRFGGGCINDCIIHLATSEMPFGGVGESGMGCYHGRFGFEEFSHLRSIVDKKTWFDLPARYQPYTKAKLKLMRKVIK